MHRSLLRTTYLAGFLLTFHIALISYVNSSFLATKVPESLVGFLYTASAIIAIFGLYVTPKLISRFGSSKTLGILVFVNIANILTLILVNNIAVISSCFVLYFAINTCLYLGLDILIEHWSENANQGSVRGMYLTALNIGFMIAPLLGGFVMDRLGFSALYSFALIILIPTFIIIGMVLPSITHTHVSKSNLLGLAKKFLRHPDLSAVFCINFILQFFYCWMVIYTPIYLHEYVHLPWNTIGELFTIMLSAFVLSQYIIGKIADRLHIERGLMITGLVIMGIATMLVARAPVATFWILAATLFMTRIGASIVEVATESYFFRHVKHDDTGSMGFFRNTYPFAYIIAPLLSSVLLKFAPVWSLFMVLGIICFLGIWVAQGINQKP
jgi:MFS family permease